MAIAVEVVVELVTGQEMDDAVPAVPIAGTIVEAAEIEDADDTVLIELISGVATITMVVGNEIAKVVEVAFGIGPTLEAVITKGGINWKGIKICDEAGIGLDSVTLASRRSACLGFIS